MHQFRSRRCIHLFLALHAGFLLKSLVYLLIPSYHNDAGVLGPFLFLRFRWEYLGLKDLSHLCCECYILIVFPIKFFLHDKEAPFCNCFYLLHPLNISWIFVELEIFSFHLICLPPPPSSLIHSVALFLLFEHSSPLISLVLVGFRCFTERKLRIRTFYVSNAND